MNQNLTRARTRAWCAALGATLALGAVAAAPAEAGVVPPGNDDFADAAQVDGLEVEEFGNNNGATKETGEPDHGGQSGGQSIWYEWTAPDSGFVTIESHGTRSNGPEPGLALRTLLGVYEGDSLASLVQQAGDADENGSGASVLFPAHEGETYEVAIDSVTGTVGSTRLNIDLEPAAEPQTVITDGPPKVIRGRGEVKAKFEFSTESGGALGYECRLDGRRWRGCMSPKTYEVRVAKKPQRHLFEVRAANEFKTDSTPAKRRFTVARKRR